MSKTRQPKKLDLKKQTLRTIDAASLDKAAGGAAGGFYEIQSRGRGTVGAP